MDFLSVRFSLSLGSDVSARVSSQCGGCLSSQLFQLCFPCGCAVQFFGVMRCDRFFLFPYHVGSHLSGGLLPLLSPGVFVSGGFSQDQLRHSGASPGMRSYLLLRSVPLRFFVVCCGLCSVVRSRSDVLGVFFSSLCPRKCVEVLEAIVAVAWLFPVWSGLMGFCFSVWGPSLSACGGTPVGWFCSLPSDM